MQGFPGVPPVSQVPTPAHPGGPNLTQYPTAPPSGFVPPSIQVVPGPATIAGAQAGPQSPGGVAGVSMAGVPGVALPSQAGGPHGLPPFPSFPLPQGFPNPFAQGPVSPGGGPPSPGMPGQTVTGPQGYFPGIGWVGQQGAGGGAPPQMAAPPSVGGYPAGMPPMPGQLGGGPTGGYPAGMPPMPGQFGGGPPGGYPTGKPPMPYAALPGGPPQGAYAGGPSLGAPPPIPGAPPGYAGGPRPFGGPASFPGAPPPTGYAGGPTGAATFPGVAPPPAPYTGAESQPPLVVAAGLPATADPSSATVGPFWLHLAWQLLQTPAVRDTLGDLFDHFVRGPNRMETVQAAAKALTSPTLQSAFNQVTAGQLDQSAFTKLFADHLKAAMAK